MPTGLNIAFAGTPELAASILESLIQHSTISFVYTRPDQPAGRGQLLQKSQVKVLAEKYQLQVKQPASRQDLELDRDLHNIDVLVVAAYGMIIPASVLAKPRYGCVNIHTSLLPRWRGAAPIQRAILAGDAITGITIIQMDAGLDTGDILYQESIPIQANDTSGTLHARLTLLGSKCIRAVLERMAEKSLHPMPQPGEGITYAQKILKQEAKIAWTKPALDIDRQIRAFNPAPVAYTDFDDKTFRIWEITVLNQSTQGVVPGTLVGYSADGIDIATGDKVIRILKLQPPGKKAMSARDFFNGNPGFARSLSRKV